MYPFHEHSLTEGVRGVTWSSGQVAPSPSRALEFESRQWAKFFRESLEAEREFPEAERRYLEAERSLEAERVTNPRKQKGVTRKQNGAWKQNGLEAERVTGQFFLMIFPSILTSHPLHPIHP